MATLLQTLEMKYSMALSHFENERDHGDVTAYPW